MIRYAQNAKFPKHFSLASLAIHSKPRFITKTSQNMLKMT